MTLTDQQREFLLVFLSDGEFNLMTSCNAIGVLPSKAMMWFKDDEFQAAKRSYEAAQLSALGYGPLRTMRDTLAIAHSDIRDVQAIDGDISSLPPDVARAIKKIEFKTAFNEKTQQLVTYPSKVEMHDKTWALKQAADWFKVDDSPEVKRAAQSGAEHDDSGPKRISGLVVRPPLTKEERDIEDLLK